jgi:transposase-like protein/predicted nucleic acid-binding protein
MAEPTKANDPADSLSDRVFLAEEVTPNVIEAFRHDVCSIDNAVLNAVVVLDTNVLLLPYSAGGNSLKQIISVFRKLGAESRLVVPAQVLREFVRNRPVKLGELQQQLMDRLSRYASITKTPSPILEDTDEYKTIDEVFKRSEDLKKELKDATHALVDKIKGWGWNDPVNSAYREVFKDEQFLEPPLDKEKALAEHQRRLKLRIPPGYKDGSKEDLGIGDFLIWKTVLEVGSRFKRPVIFVSGDEKADWHHQSNGSSFLPRYELLDEYRRSSEGAALYIIPLSRLLELMEVEQTSIVEIKAEEERVQVASFVSVDCPSCKRMVDWRLSESIGSSSHPRCPYCATPFHIHRTREGVTVHRSNGRPGVMRANLEEKALAVEIIGCIACDNEILFELGLYPPSTAWPKCEECGAKFPVHRKRDGEVRIGGISQHTFSRDGGGTMDDAAP